ncbi:NDR1/HIN1-like protein 6 [Nymphaea colorata]|uniref:NDR1/HIN1-like protein 6 n=1 Tax=Nymphaea colorata TaxID=210225 RepID=UPI00129D9B22|nr:NDR1/HIN1-like protein 6 [Nymphaea colorata]
MSRNLPEEDPALSAAPQLRNHSSSCCCRCCCCCCYCLFFILFVILVLVVLLAAVFGLFYLWYRPVLPAFHLQELTVKDLAIDPKPDKSSLSANVTVRVQATNRNKKLHLCYRDFRCWVTAAGGVRFGEGSAPGLTQQDGNVTVIDLQAAVQATTVDRNVGESIEKGVAAKTLAVAVELRTAVGTRVGDVNTKQLPIRLICGPATIKQLDGGDAPKCKIRLFGW